MKKRNSGYGYWTVTDALKRTYNLIINHKRVYRLMKEYNLLAKKYGSFANPVDG
ncbi:transposase [Lactobacillus johnsonii]|uniref:transposase n=1 Tax=Lactobacillus johnsonii TaxID=33959 RepID=UPI003D80ABA3